MKKTAQNEMWRALPDHTIGWRTNTHAVGAPTSSAAIEERLRRRFGAHANFRFSHKVKNRGSRRFIVTTFMVCDRRHTNARTTVTRAKETTEVWSAS